jgi:hypothetical protein
MNVATTRQSRALVCSTVVILLVYGYYGCIYTDYDELKKVYTLNMYKMILMVIGASVTLYVYVWYGKGSNVIADATRELSKSKQEEKEESISQQDDSVSKYDSIKDDSVSKYDSIKDDSVSKYDSVKDDSVSKDDGVKDDSVSKDDRVKDDNVSIKEVDESMEKYSDITLRSY